MQDKTDINQSINQSECNNIVFWKNQLNFNFTQVPNEVILDTRLKPSDFRLYAFYLMVSIKTPESYYSIEKISELLGIVKNTIRASNKVLIDLKYIKQEKKPRQNPFGYYTVTTILPIENDKSFTELLNSKVQKMNPEGSKNELSEGAKNELSEGSKNEPKEYKLYNNINLEEKENLNKNIITSELDSLVNHDAVELESPASPNNNILKSDSGISQSDFQADDQAILSASDNLKQDAHSDTESPLTENRPPKNKNSIQKDNIQNNGIDIELQNIRQAEKQELINFKTELLKSYSRLMGRMPSELKQTETLKTEKARAELKAIFKARKYDWRECIEYAERKVERHDFDFRWYNFLKTLKRILERGLEDGSIRRHYSAEKRYYKDLERKKEYEKEMAEMRAEEQAEADKLGMTLEEYREWVREENDRAMAKFEAEMKARFEAERKAKNEADGIKTLTSGIKADTSEPRANEGLSTSEADAQNMAKAREELKARAEQNKTANKNILELLKNGGMQAVYQSL